MNNGLVDWTQYLLSFALVIGLLVGCLWMLRKMQSSGGLRQRGTARLKVVETVSMGPRQKVALIQLDGQDVLVGVTAHAISALNVPTARIGLHLDTRA